MIDPKTRLAFSFANAPGSMAVLIGAGVSRAAGIPSGWEVLVTLIQQVAKAEGKQAPAPDAAEEWFRTQTGQPPTYSNVLQSVASTPAQRHALLAKFFDPAESAHEPTPTHHAVARLAAAGLVRVIVTTNFDQLLEQALAAAGVVPRVVASPAQMAGMTPLAHSRCTVIKVHGDYLHGDLRNSDDEIGIYPPEIDAVLNRVFDEYGLFVVGWSGTWDHALRAAIERAPNRRYPQTWLAVGATSPAANNLIAHRGMDVIASGSADSVVPGIADTAIALHSAQTPSPDDEFALIERQKRYLRVGSAGDMDHILMLADVRDRLTELVRQIPSSFITPTEEERLREYRLTAESLEQHSAAACALAFRGLRFGSSEVRSYWIETVGQLAKLGGAYGGFSLQELRVYPAILIAYAYVLGALVRKDGEAIRELWSHRLDRDRGNDDRLLDAVCIRVITPRHFQLAFKDANGQMWKAQGSRRVSSLLASRVAPIVGNQAEAERAFARVEYLWSLALAVRTWDPVPGSGIDGFVGLHLFEDAAGAEFARQLVAQERPWDWVLPSGCLQTNAASTLEQVLPAFNRENSRQLW